jgi:predicted DNA-binding ribbon-helix-helix protein
MSTITLRLPDTQHERLKDLAAAKGVSLNKLLEELTARVIAEADTEVRFRARAARGNAAEGLRILERLDEHYKTV